MKLRLPLTALLFAVLSASAAPNTPSADGTNSATAATTPTKVELKSKPPARLAAPAFVDVVTFNVQSSADKQKLIVTSAPGISRIDAPDDRLSIIYSPATQHYTGLEHSNFTYWEFSWPEVRNSVQNTARYASRLRDMGPELLEENAIAAPSTNADISPPPPPSDSAGDDNSGYVWHTDAAKKRLAGIDCVHWIGETVAGEKIEAWCAPRLIPEVEQALATLQEINEPIALVPVRNFMPPLTFVAWKTLTKAGVTPVLMTWGSDAEFNRFMLEGYKQRDGKLAYFEVPKVYNKTTLVTMDGIGNQRPTSLNRDVPSTAQSNPLVNPPLNNR